MHFVAFVEALAMIELYILPGTFSLPSLCGSCVAALSLCQLSLTENDLTVVYSTDLSLVPAIKVSSEVFRGYSNIKKYLSTINDIDNNLSATQKSDIVAWGSLIQDLGDTLTVLPWYTQVIIVECAIRVNCEFHAWD